MAISTLVVGFSEFQVSGFVELVAARGIDRVIVVGSNADFSSSSEIAGITTQSSAVQSAGIEVQLAQASANAVLSIPQATFQSIRSAGLEFVNDPILSSFSATNTFVLPSGSIDAFGSEALFTSFDFDSLANNDLGTDTASASLSVPASFGSQTTVAVSDISTPGSSFSASNQLSDFYGTVKVNLTASEFQGYLDNNFDTSGIKQSTNVVVVDSLSTSPISNATSGVVDFSVSEFNALSTKAANHSYHTPP